MNSKQNTAKKIDVKQAPENKLVVGAAENKAIADPVSKYVPTTALEHNRLARTRPRSEVPRLAKVDETWCLNVDPASARQTFGTSNMALIDRLMAQMVFGSPATQRDESENCNGLLAALHEIGPRDVLESMLITQMINTHNHAMYCLAKVRKQTQHADNYMNQAIKLQAMFARQVDALTRYRSKDAPAAIAITEVHVHDRGAIDAGDSSAPTRKEENGEFESSTSPKRVAEKWKRAG